MSPVVVWVSPVYRPVHLPPDEFFRRQRSRLRNVRGFLDRGFQIHPSPGILGFQHNRPAVMDVHHAAFTVLGDLRRSFSIPEVISRKFIQLQAYPRLKASPPIFFRRAMNPTRARPARNSAEISGSGMGEMGELENGLRAGG